MYYTGAPCENCTWEWTQKLGQSLILIQKYLRELQFWLWQIAFILNFSEVLGDPKVMHTIINYRSIAIFQLSSSDQVGLIHTWGCMAVKRCCCAVLFLQSLPLLAAAAGGVHKRWSHNAYTVTFEMIVSCWCRDRRVKVGSDEAIQHLTVCQMLFEGWSEHGSLFREHRTCKQAHGGLEQTI